MTLTARFLIAALWVAVIALSGAAQMSGTYTIDPQGSGPRNYKAFAAATAALGVGVNGPVVFSVAPAKFREDVVLDKAIAGTSATNTVTFIARGNPATIEGSGGTYGWSIRLGSVQWVRFSNFRLISGGIALQDTRDSVISGLTVENLSSPRYAVGIFYPPTQRNIFRMCVFRGGNTFVAYVKGTNTVFDGCEFDGAGQSRLGVIQAERSVIQNCLVHSPQDWYCLYDDGENRVLNNVFIANTSHPTVAHHDASLRTWNSAPTFKNNIVINLGSGPALLHCLDDLGSPPRNLLHTLVSDHNAVYAPNASGAIRVDGTAGGWPKTVYFNGSLTSFHAWQKANAKYIPTGGAAGYDLNSFEGNPGLVSLKAPYDIHLNPTSPLIDQGTARIVEPYQTQMPPHRVTHDLDGDVRGWKPDIGADEIAARITGSGGTSPGATHALALAAPRDGGRGYQVGSSFGTGPIGIGWRPLGLGVDDLLVLSVGNYWPQVFAGYRGGLDKSGNGQASIRLPKITALVGQVIHSAFVTFDPQAKFGLGSISTTHSLTVTK